MKNEYDFTGAERGKFHRPPTTLVPPHAEAEERLRISDTVDASVARGPESWNFLYFGLAFSIAIEGTIIQMLTPRLLGAPWNLALYAAAAACTIWLFISNGRFQNLVFDLKRKYEDRAR